MANTQLSDTIHVLTYIAYFKDQKITSQAMASSLQTSPSLVRKILANLKRGGLVCPGQATTHVSLAKPAAEITMRDIYRTLPDRGPLLNVDTKTNEDCPVGAAVPVALNRYYVEIQAAVEDRMARITLQDILADIALQNDR
ncbi:Rrf2 family transcriptional regulator [Levilactobacillus brevis]|uniref:Rrf2 family transcriptional regulator n=1 Tax=Levilactobacillus brevis TaxID=1580 RepID=A0AA41JSU3_LEVBR|nr:Rrf2 family transcriptional regulator [Levilactobacillus brevis]MBS0946633.1 Rrf2 family transcriptional regulator [Levilactobacillus brevis]MBS1009954.1 Rrf2 family transcriptional regulator [Levilactobacillus brevis]